MAQSVSITYQLGTHSRTSLIKTYTASLAGAVSAAQALASYTNAAIPLVTYTEGATTSIAEKTAEMQSVDLFALCLFRDDELNIVKFAIPAPVKSQFDATNRGWRMKQEHGIALASIVGTLRGETLTFVKAYITGKSEADG